MFDESEVPLDVIVDLVQHIHAYEGDGAILIFLSGWEEISAVREAPCLNRGGESGKGGARTESFEMIPVLIFSHTQTCFAPSCESDHHMPPTNVRWLLLFFCFSPFFSFLGARQARDAAASPRMATVRPSQPDAHQPAARRVPPAAPGHPKGKQAYIRADKI